MRTGFGVIEDRYVEGEGERRQDSSRERLRTTLAYVRVSRFVDTTFLFSHCCLNEIYTSLSASVSQSIHPSIHPYRYLHMLQEIYLARRYPPHPTATTIASPSIVLGNSPCCFRLLFLLLLPLGDSSGAHGSRSPPRAPAPAPAPAVLLGYRHHPTHRTIHSLLAIVHRHSNESESRQPIDVHIIRSMTMDDDRHTRSHLHAYTQTNTRGSATAGWNGYMLLLLLLPSRVPQQDGNEVCERDVRDLTC